MATLIPFVVCANPVSSVGRSAPGTRSIVCPTAAHSANPPIGVAVMPCRSVTTRVCAVLYAWSFFVPCSPSSLSAGAGILAGLLLGRLYIVTLITPFLTVWAECTYVFHSWTVCLEFRRARRTSSGGIYGEGIRWKVLLPLASVNSSHSIEGRHRHRHDPVHGSPLHCHSARLIYSYE